MEFKTTGVTIHVGPADSSDFPAIVRLLSESGLPTEDLSEGHLRDFLLARVDREMIGCVGVELYPPYGLLRSLAVSHGYQKKGLAGFLVRSIEDYSKERDIQELYLLTCTAESFFRNRDYSLVPRQSAPGPIRETREFSESCRDCPAFMRKVLIQTEKRDSAFPG